MTSGRSKPAVEEEASRCGSSRAASGHDLAHAAAGAVDQMADQAGEDLSHL